MIDLQAKKKELIEQIQRAQLAVAELRGALIVVNQLIDEERQAQPPQPREKEQ